MIIGSKLINTKSTLHSLDISKKEIHAVIIGDEILSGKREDKHLKHLSKKLKDYGLCLSKVDYIPDDLEIIRKIIQEKIGSIVFCFGGIGATPDDFTRHAAALAHKNPIVQNSKAKQLIENQFGKDAYPKRILMADLPDNAELIPNVINNIPGFLINHHHFMPGFPEMAWPMIDWVINNRYKTLINFKDVEDQSIWLDDVSESMLIDTMNEIQNKNKEIKIYSLPKLRPNKTLELGVKGASNNVNKAMADLKSHLEKLQFNWREN